MKSREYKWNTKNGEVKQESIKTYRGLTEAYNKEYKETKEKARKFYKTMKKVTNTDNVLFTDLGKYASEVHAEQLSSTVFYYEDSEWNSILVQRQREMRKLYPKMKFKKKW